MSDIDLPLPFQAYVGDQPYIFVSYAHKDGERVFAEIRDLHAKGYRIWYDEGIDPGNKWPEEIAKALAGAHLFLVFISPIAVQSQNVRNEINFALKRQKPFLAVHLENTDLPLGLELQMGDIQAIMKWRLTNDHYQQKIIKAIPHELCEPLPSKLTLATAFARPSEKTSEPLIVAGKGWGKVSLGVERKTVESVIGKGQNHSWFDKVYFIDHPEKGIQISYNTNDDTLHVVFFYNGDEGYENFATFQGKTDRGIDWTASPQDVIRAYGKPKEDHKREGSRRIVFDGIDFRWVDGEMVRIGIFKK